MGAEAYRSAIRIMIGQRWDELWNTLPRVLDDADTDAVHDVRVASRRLRAAMDIAGTAFPESWFQPLHDIAREITRELGTVRDLDVMLDYFISARDDAPPNERPGIERVIARIEPQRAAARTTMKPYVQELMKRDLQAETNRRFSVDRTKVKRA